MNTEFNDPQAPDRPGIVLALVVSMAAILLVPLKFMPSASADELRWLPFEVFRTEGYLAATQARATAVNSEEEWREFWATAGLKQPRSPTPQVPPVPPGFDFAMHSLLVVTMGEKPEGGYGVVFAYVKESSDRVDVSLVATRAGPGCAVTAASTYPIATARIVKTSKPVLFRVEDAVIDCVRPAESGTGSSGPGG